MNLVLTGGKKIVEIQGTAEQKPFDDGQLERLLELGKRGIEQLIARQQRVLSNLLLRQ
jgi:ribonuclease PH